MAVLNEITVGSIKYYIVDEKPTHAAVKGSIAINFKNNNRLYINNDGATTWFKVIEKEHGSMFWSNNTTLRPEDGQNTWVVINNVTATAGNLKGFTVSSNSLIYSGDKITNCQTTISGTIRGASRSKSFELGAARNLIAPNRFNGCFPEGTTFQKVNSIRIDNIANGDNYIAALRWLSTVQVGGPPGQRDYAVRNLNLKSVKLDEADVVFMEDWESNSFTTNNWTVVNGTTNVWVLGTAENFTTDGQRAVYISNDGGTSASYNITTAAISHFYRDFTIPESDGDVILKFAWKSWAENGAGETNWDYGTVVMTDTSVTPTAGTEVSTAQATLVNTIPTGNGRIGAVTNLGKFNLAYGGADNNWRVETINLSNYKGQTKRIVFTWVNDASVGANPPFVVDDIKIETF